MKMIFKNKQEIVYEYALETSEYYDGAERQVMSIEFDPANVTLKEVNDIASNEDNIVSFTLVNDSDSSNIITNIYDDFAIKMEVSQQRVPSQDISESKEIIRLKLGKYTTIEKKLKELGAL